VFDDPITILFYVNLALMFCVLAQGVTLIILCRKTAYMDQVGLTAVFMYGFGLIAFVVQLIMYTLGNAYAPYAVCAAFGLLYVGFIASCVYMILLGGRSNRALCTACGIFSLLPPVGTALIILLSQRLNRDTAAQSLVFGGYKFTIGAINALIARDRTDFIDAADGDEFEKLGKRDARKYVKRLKRRAKDPNGMFEYAKALIHYQPKKTKKALKLMTKSANRGCSEAMFNVGYFYETGTYFKRDVKRAIDYYKRAASAGDKDAELRLGIAEVISGNAGEGAEIFNDGMKKGDDYAQYNLALCYESGKGKTKDFTRALELFSACAKRGMFVAQRHLLALAARCVTEGGDTDSEIAGYDFSGDLKLMLRGISDIKEKNANAAAEHFLDAVKLRGKWEGVARLFVGTLYMDCGKLGADRQNGAAYVKSAFGLTPLAEEIYFTVPKAYRGKTIKEKPNKRPDVKVNNEKSAD